MFALILIAATYQVSAEEVASAHISDSGANIYFRKDLPSFKSALADDKHSLTLSFSSLDAPPDSIRHLLGKSGITEMYWQVSGKTAKLLVRFDGKRGYTIARQPFSRSITIETFSWSNLSPAEDDYRSGLLAEESAADSIATELYKRAFSGGIAAAALRLGVMAAADGNIELATEWLGKARESGIRSAELTAASAYLARAKGDIRGAEFFADHFAKQTGQRLIFDRVGDFPPPATDLLDGEPTPIAVSFNEEVDTQAKQNTATTSDIDKRFANLFGTEKQPENTARSTESSIIPAWAKTGSLAIMAFFCTGGFYIGFTYFRWRSAKIRRRKNRPKATVAPAQDFAQELHSAALAQSAARAYSPAALDVTIDGMSEVERPKASPPAKPTERLTKPAPEKLSKAISPPASDAEPHSEIESLAGIFPPSEVQLAIRLHSQRRAHKTAALQSFVGNDVPAEHFRLAQTARTLGVEQAGLELKKALEGDNDHVARLYKKFVAQIN